MRGCSKKTSREPAPCFETCTPRVAPAASRGANRGIRSVNARRRSGYDGDVNDPYSQLFDVSPFPALVSRLADHAVLAVNARTSEVIGISPRDAIGRAVTDFYVDPAERVELADRLRRDGRADDLRLQIRRADGEPFWVLAS